MTGRKRVLPWPVPRPVAHCRLMAVDFEAVRRRALAAEKAREEEQRRAAERTVALLPRAATILRRDFGAGRVGYFGSLLWGRLWDESDVDLYVDRIPPGKNYFLAIGAVADLLGRNVDLIELEACSESLRKRIAEDGREIPPEEG